MRNVWIFLRDPEKLHQGHCFAEYQICRRETCLIFLHDPPASRSQYFNVNK